MGSGKIISRHIIDETNIVVEKTVFYSGFGRLHGNGVLGMPDGLQRGDRWLDPEGPAPLRIYSGILATAARTSGKTVISHFCGNAGGMRHRFTIHLTRLYSGEISVEHFLQESWRDRVAYLGLTLQMGECAAFRRCAACGALRDGPEWQESDQLFNNAELKTGLVVPVVYSICWDCCEKTRASISRLFANRPESAILDNLLCHPCTSGASTEPALTESF